MAPHALDPVTAFETSTTASTDLPSRDKDSLPPIAIVGLSFGFPQDATSSDQFWQLMMEKRHTSTEVPGSRFNADQRYHPDPSRKGQIEVKQGHFLKDDFSTFDAPFFNITAADAAAMDPLQRGLLEYTYKALESAGIPIEKAAGTKTSVYTGSFCLDWLHWTLKDVEQCATTSALGVNASINANRLSWFFNFTGNSANVDTACSSSLVCLDLGCTGLLNGDSEMSVVAGCNLMNSPDTFHFLTSMNMLSPDGLCYSFDHRANGYSRGEGFGVLILKRLSDALRDGDTIRAVIRSTGCNQDGYTPGITMPNSSAQETLIGDTYAKAGLSMQPTRYFEAHGTGTPVGDPLECTALGNAFRKVRTVRDPLYVGALKSNIGHLEGASGIAGVIKSVLILEKGIIPPNASFEKINPKIDAEFLRIKFPLEPTPWPTRGLRRASVNSFGFGGSNAHVVLDDAFHYLSSHHLIGNHATVEEPTIVRGSHQVKPDTETVGHSLHPRLLMFSARDDKGTNRQADQYADWFSAHPIQVHRFERYMDNLAYTLACRRSALQWTSFAVASSMEDLKNIKSLMSPVQKAIELPSIGFIFTGQGAQWAQMGRDLQSYPVFLRSLITSEDYFLSLGSPWSLRHELFKDVKQSQINKPDFSQPICTAIQIALLELLRSFGIYPTAVAGHSSGEIAAAYCVGAISAESALRIAYYRGVCAAAVANSPGYQGAMMSVGLSEEHVKPYLDTVNKLCGVFDLTIACINSPKNVTISGGNSHIDMLKTHLDADQLFARKLVVNIAYHSPHMERVSAEYRDRIKTLHHGEVPQLPIAMISSVTGERATLEELRSPDYWVANLVSPVRFSESVGHMFAKSNRRVRKKLDLSHRDHFHINTLLEIGPHSALQGPIRDILTELPNAAKIGYGSVLVRNSPAIQSLMTSVGNLRSIGYPVNIERVNRIGNKGKQRYMTLPDLPGYPFDKSKRYWHDTRLGSQFINDSQMKLDLLGKPVMDWNPLEPKWRNFLRISEMPWIEDHFINGTLIYPAAGMLVMAIEAANQMADPTKITSGFELKDCQFLRSLNIPQDSNGIEVQISLNFILNATQAGTPWADFRVCAHENGEWHECSRGFVRAVYQATISEIDNGKEVVEDINAYRAIETDLSDTCSNRLDSAILYQTLNSSGFGFGPAFQPIINAAYSSKHDAKADVKLFQWPKDQFPQPHIVHPTSLDGMLHLAIAGYARGGQVPTMIPTLLRHLYISKTGLNRDENEVAKTCTWLVAEDNRGKEFDGSVLDPAMGQVLARIHGLRLTTIADAVGEDDSAYSNRQICYHVEFSPDPALLDNWQIGQYSLSEYISLLSHKDPNIKILDLGSGQTHMTEDALKMLAYSQIQQDAVDDLRCSVYHYTARSEDTINKAKDVFKPFSRASFVDLDLTTDLVEQGLDAASYDLILLGDALDEIHDLAPLQYNLQRLLSPRGCFCITAANASLISPVDFGFEVAGTTSSGVKIARPQSTQAKDVEPKEVVFVIESKSKVQIEAAETLAQYFERSLGLKSRMANLEEAAGTNSAQQVVFVVLLELDNQFLFKLSSTQYDVLKRFLIGARDIVWINPGGGSTSGKPEYGIANGFGRAMRNEYQAHRFSILQLDTDGTLSPIQMAMACQVLERNHLDQNATEIDPEYLEIGEKLHIPRIIPSATLGEYIYLRSLPKQTGVHAIEGAPPLSLTIGSPGLLDTLHFIEDKAAFLPLGDDEVEMKTMAVGMNFKDLLIALGQVPGLTFGLECAGIVTRVGRNGDFKVGDRIMMADPHTFRTYARGNIHAAVKIDAAVSFVEAAAIPTQFGTAWEAVHEMGRLVKGETMLIHAAAGGTGQAAIQIAQYIGATIFATVSSTSKKQLLIDEYGIPEDHIFYSRDTSFAKGVMRMTQGRGVDMVLNSLAGDSLIASWECIASYGRFLEIGKRDIISNSNLPMYTFRKNASFIAFDASAWLKEKPWKAQVNLRVLADLFAKGKLRTAKPLHVFNIAEYEKVFRLMQDGKTAGKIVFEITDEAQVPTTLETKPSFQLEPNATYVIAGGLGGLGRSIARWMVSRSARNLILLSRSGAKNETAIAFLKELKDQGVRVEAPPCDVTNTAQMKVVFEDLKEMPPIKGCVQGSMVRRDELFEGMGFESYRLGAECKTIGSWNLHTMLPKGLDFFIILSSASGLVGLRGQTNYSAGNTYEDALARYRVAQGEKAISLDLGAMIDDGLLAENQDLLSLVLAYGTLNPISRVQFFAILDYYCNPALPVLTPLQSQAVIGLGAGKGSGLDGVDLESQPVFRHLLHAANRSGGGGTGGQGDDVNYRELISVSTTLVEAGNVVATALVKKLAKSLSALDDGADVDLFKPLIAFGVDSLLAVELRNWISKAFMADVAVFETLGGSTFNSLSMLVAGRTGFKHPNWTL